MSEVESSKNQGESPRPTIVPGGGGRLGAIFLTVFIDLLGFGLVMPLLPRYAESMHATPLQIGLLGASYSGMQFVFVPVWGRLSDRIGRRPVLLGSILATQMHQAFTPSFAPVSHFGSLLVLELPAILVPLSIAAGLGALGGLAGERLLPSG